MSDALKIRETLAVARENIARLDMSSFAKGKVNPDAADWRECGVTFCLAGWRCVLDGLRPVPDEYGYATDLFAAPDDTKYSASSWAARSMNLTDEEESALFWRTQNITDIDALDWIAERIIEGCELDRCDACGTQGRVYEHGEYERCDACEGHGFVLAEDVVW